MTQPRTNTPWLLVALAAAAPLGAQTEVPPEASAGARPNIVLVITDDQGYGPIGRHGHPWIQTPHLDQLHDQSVRFTRFLVSPTCAPTRAALMTGRHPMRNGVTHTINERERLTLDATTLPQVLATAGYTSGIFGKWHLGDEDAYQPGARGFDEVFIHGAGGIGQAYKCSCADAPGNKYFDPVVRHNGTFVKARGFCTDVFFSGALGWIERVKDEDGPFFAYITTNAPHGPFLAPPTARERFKALGFTDKAAGYYGMVENIDQNMGRLAASLKEWGLEEDTVVIFMSDNGMTGNGAGRGVLGQTADGNELSSYNAGQRGLKGSVDEGGVRVPFFVRWDGRLEAGREVDVVSAHIDLLPTLAELAGVEPPAQQVEGRSLLGLLTGAADTAPDRYLFSHVGRWPVGADPRGFKHKGSAVRSARFRLVNDQALYDMLADPGQTTNVLEQHPDEVAAMRAAYDTWWEGTLPRMDNEGVPMSSTRPYHVAHEAQVQAGGIPSWSPPGRVGLRGSGPDLHDFTTRPEGGVQLVGEDGHLLVPEGEATSRWRFADGVLTASPGWDSLVTPESYQDFRMHVEFNVNEVPDVDRERNGNSGVYLQQRYEIQILNSHGVGPEAFTASDCGSLYRLRKPDHLVARPAGEWQTYDILFRAARFDGARKVEDMQLTVIHNGVVIHDAVAVPRKTGAGRPEGPDPRPIKLQGHANEVRFRNVWIEPLSLHEFPKKEK